MASLMRRPGLRGQQLIYVALKFDNIGFVSPREANSFFREALSQVGAERQEGLTGPYTRV